MRHGVVPWITVLVGLLALLASRAGASSPAATCLSASGDGGAWCLKAYAAAIEKCRRKQDPLCEADARAAGGALDDRLARPEDRIRRRCSDAAAEPLGYFDVEDVVFRIPEACMDFAEDLLDLAFADDLGTLTPPALSCQRSASRKLRQLRTSVVREFGAKCFARNFAGSPCDRTRRDTAVERVRSRVHRQILESCGSEFDALQLSTLQPASTLEERIDDVLERVINRARHFAQRVYPPNDLGPRADFGPFPVGVRTLDLADVSRLNVAGTGPRPVTTEVYYPSTPEAVAGLPRDVAKVLGIPVTETPAVRDVALAPGAYPLVLFSHGNNGIRIQSFFFAAHLASHGFIVATPDHHGNTFVDELIGIIDPQPAISRPLDMSFLIDAFLAFNVDPGSIFADAVDSDRIGMSGHSFGGYTTFALAGGSFELGTFTDPRVKAIFPQAPWAVQFLDDFFSTITIPTLIVGGSIDETTPFATDQQRPFDNLPSGATVVALAQLADAGHFTFSDFCEVPRDLLGFLGGFDEACEPRHLPWRHAHDIVNFLALNFFDGVLNGNAAALTALAPENLVAIEDLTYQSK